MSLGKRAATKKFWNFCGGPSVLPMAVKEQAMKDFMNAEGSPHSMFEFNHRSPPFYAMQKDTKDNLREFLKVPDEFEILFFQGGSHLMFSSVGWNLFDRKNPVMMNVCTGWWSYSTGSELANVGKVH